MAKLPLGLYSDYIGSPAFRNLSHPNNTKSYPTFADLAQEKTYLTFNNFSFR